MPPKEIFKQIKFRLTITNSLWEKMDKDDVEQVNAIYFKYYFDISCAIEACIRGIIFEYTKCSLSGAYIKELAKPNVSSTSYFVSKELFFSIVGTKIFDNVSHKEVINYKDLINALNDYDISKLKFDFDEVKNTYQKIKKIRNALAHGLTSMANNVEFSNNVLFDFIYIFYLIHNYYINIYNKINLEGEFIDE